MAQQELRSTIVLNGRVDKSANTISSYLDGVANRLLTMGSIVNQLSQPLIDVGKQSVELYKGYDDTMKYIKALGELTGAQMDEMDAAAREAGRNTRYTATQAAEALQLGAVAGLNYRDNMALLNDELTLAAAGNLELEVATSQLLTALSVTGTPLEDAGTLIDRMVKAAASSKTDVGGLGEAIQRLGVTMNYLNGGSVEMLTIFGELGNLGAESAEMGTWARNILLALIAPTQKSSEVMEELGYSIDDVDEALEGIEVDASQKLIERLGLEVYDSETGELRNLFDILSDLDTALSSMTSEERNRAMATIFNKRTLGYAEGLMRVAASGEWRELFSTIADADGYAERVAATRESGIGGVMRRLNSEWEDVQLTVGEFMEPQITAVAGLFSGAMDWFNSFDEATKARVLSTLEGIAVTGPALLTAGGALKLIGLLCTPTGLIAGGIAAVAGLAIAMEQLGDVRFSDSFGAMELDMDALSGFVTGLSGDFRASYAEVTAFDAATGAALETYASLRSELGGKLLTAQMTGGELDLQYYRTAGGEMLDALREGMKSAAAAQLETLNTLREGGLSDGSWSILTDLVLSGYDSDMETLSQISADLFNALTGDLDPEEAARIVLDCLEQIDATAEEYRARTRAIQNRALIEQAGWVTQENAQDYIEMLGTSYRQDINDFDQTYAMKLAGLWQAIQDETDPLKKAEAQAAYTEAVNARDALRADLAQPYEAAVQAAVDSIMNESGLASYYSDMRRVLGGEMTMAEYAAMYSGPEAQSQINRMIEMLQPVASAIEQSNLGANNLGALANSGGTIWDWLGLGNDFSRAYNLETLRYSLTSPFRGVITPSGGGPGVGGDPLWAGVAVNTEGIAADIAGAAAEPYTVENISAETQEMGHEITQEAGRERDVPVSADLAKLKKQIEQEIEHKERILPVRLQISGGGGLEVPGYAEGGRADSPSIFGEAGPEWAIPERHTPRTAELLRKAAAASGFDISRLAPARGAESIVFAPHISVSGGGDLEGAIRRAQKSFFSELQRAQLISASTKYGQG